MDAFDWSAIECPLCGAGSEYWRPLVRLELNETHRRAGDVETVQYVYCSSCGMQFAERFWTQSSIARYYEEGDYRNSTNGQSPDVTPEDIRHETARLAALWPILANAFAKVDSYLDVGSSTGALLLNMQYHYQPRRCKGIEPSWRFRKYCTARGLSVFSRLALLDPSEKYDLVTANHVLEHQTDPVGFLASLKRHVGRYLFVQVPINLPTLAHAVLFTESTLVRTIERAGYVLAHWVAPTPPARDYTIICEVRHD